MPMLISTIRPPTNPLVRALYFVVGGLLLIGALVIGVAVFAIALGVALVASLVIYARFRWFARKLGQQQAPRDRNASAAQDVLEVEYEVVRERSERDG